MWWKLWRRHWQGILIEVLAVFIGVTGAFALDSYRESAEKAERRQQTLELMLKDVIDAEQRVAAGLAAAHQSEFVGGFLQALENGERPPLRFFWLEDFNSPQIWMSMLQAGGAEVLSVDTLRELENLIILNDIAIAQNRVFNQLVQLHLVPVLDQPAAFFYQTDTSKLRLQFGWYRYYLKNSLAMSEKVSQGLPKLRKALEAELER